ncbi:MAG: hypothetical protein QOD84_1685 [Acidobacteriaceae bacterium]
MITAPIFLHQGIEGFASQIVNSTLQGTAVAVVLAIIIAVFSRRWRGQNSSTRFALYFCVMIAVTAIPCFRLLSHAPVAPAPEARVTVPSSWAAYFLAVWTVASFVALGRLAASMGRLREIRRAYVPLEVSSLDPVLRNTLHKFAGFRPVSICVSDNVQVPAVLGFISPAIVLPRWALRELDADELNRILIHELAHVRRWDDWTNLAQKLLRAVFFFHPAVWWLESKLSLEREMACDDVVLAETTDSRAYAECLVSVAEKVFSRRGVALAQMVIGRVRETSRRVAHILNVNRPLAGTKAWAPLLVVMPVLLVAAAVSVPDLPQLVAFHDGALLGSTAAMLPMPRAPQLLQARAVTKPQELHSTVLKTATKVLSAREKLSASRPKHWPPANASVAQAENSSIEAAGFRTESNSPYQRIARMEASPQTRTLLLVMASERYDEFGASSLNIAVWQVTIEHTYNSRHVFLDGSVTPAKKI